MSSMTLGHVYDMDLRKNENTIKEVIVQAQGEVRSPVSKELSAFVDHWTVDGSRRIYPAGQRDLDQLYP